MVDEIIESKDKKIHCPICGGTKVIAYEHPRYISYKCYDCREDWKKFITATEWNAKG